MHDANNSLGAHMDKTNNQITIVPIFSINALDIPEDEFMAINKLVEMMSEERKSVAIGDVQMKILQGKIDVEKNS